VTDPAASHAATVVAMPPDIDYGSADQAYDQLNAALITDAPVVIADFTLTTYCDCAALRRLLAIQGQANGRHADFRIAVPLSSPVRRILRITGLEQEFKLFPTAAHAAAAFQVPAPRVPYY
jgi:anti-anti-sigma factor